MTAFKLQMKQLKFEKCSLEGGLPPIGSINPSWTKLLNKCPIRFSLSLTLPALNLPETAIPKNLSFCGSQRQAKAYRTFVEQFATA